jgi:Oxidoreductase family, NAD-binding Rossmann fold
MALSNSANAPTICIIILPAGVVVSIASVRLRNPAPESAIRCPNVEAVAAADIYPRRFVAVKALVPQIKTYGDFRQLLDDKSVDAVLIATPQHQHVLNFVPAIQAGKECLSTKRLWGLVQGMSSACVRHFRDRDE